MTEYQVEVIKYRLTKLFLLIVASLFSGGITAKSLIFHGGDILTMDKSMTAELVGMPEAIIVEDGIITVIGTKAEIFGAKSSNAQVVDLQGKTLMPGLIAVHSHPEIAASMRSFVDLSAYSNDNPTQVWRRLEAAVEHGEKNAWFFAKGLDVVMVPGLEAPTLEYLDSIAPHTPLFIFSQMLHSAWTNTKGLEVMGITNQTPNPAPGSYYEKDSNGDLTGYIHEGEAIKPIGSTILKNIDVMSDVVVTLDDYSRQGITTISTLGLMDTDENRYIYMSTYLLGLSGLVKCF